MGKAKFFLGAEGQGANMKLVVNAVMGAMMASFAEGMSLADEVRLVLQTKQQLAAFGSAQRVAFAG
jgi:glyoxylate/succinic semialdehyde reductase